MSARLSREIDSCIEILKKKTHQVNMCNKRHSLHCIIHKYLGFFIYLYGLAGIKTSSGKFSCDFEWRHMNTTEYNNNLNRPCTYSNINFVQYEQGAVQNMHLFMCNPNFN